MHPMRCILAGLSAWAALAAAPLFAQCTAIVTTANRGVGGILVDTDGVLRNVDSKARKELGELRAKALEAVATDLQAATPLRLVSLRRLQDVIREAHAKQQPLPDEVRYLAGLQRIRYVFLDDANKDIVIGGPAEGWKAAANGAIVGTTNNQPVLTLDDLAVVLRSIDSARNGGISCSIDPTQEGLKKVAAYVATLKTINNPQPIAAKQEELLGDQEISVTGVPDDSRFAQVMVAADYRMKRLGMKLDPSPVKGFVSYLDMVGAREALYPRWWLSPSYEPLGKDAEGMAWELRGTGVKCQSAEDQFGEDGQRKVGQATNSAARWAESMTKHYDALCVAEPVFAELRGCMDLAVVAALIQKERLTDRVDLKLDVLLDAEALPHAVYAVPKHVPSVSSHMKKGSNWLITASGGVLFQPWELVQKTTVDAKPAEAKTKALAARTKSWWWN